MPEPLNWDGFKEAASSMALDLDEEQISSFRHMLALLHEGNAAASLTSAVALADAIRQHFVDALTLVPVIRSLRSEGVRLADVGSGAGFPGLPLKIAWPEISLTLIEATTKKAKYLEHVVAELGIEAEVLGVRAELAGRNVGLRDSFDLVTARAVGSLPLVCELTLPLCKVGGRLLAQRGESAGADALGASAAVSLLGARVMGVEAVDASFGLGNRHTVIIQKIDPTPDRYPRREGIPAKRPLN